MLADFQCAAQIWAIFILARCDARMVMHKMHVKNTYKETPNEIPVPAACTNWYKGFTDLQSTENICKSSNETVEGSTCLISKTLI